MLWIAFKIVPLTYLIQLAPWEYLVRGSCELLSKLYLWHIWSSKIIDVNLVLKVVNCFQNCTFDISDPALSRANVELSKLWIAFKIVPLTYLIQHHLSMPASLHRCELLSKLYLWHIWSSFGYHERYMRWVVNCFQNCTFDISDPALLRFLTFAISLWIAFKIVPLTYLIQLNMYKEMKITNLPASVGLKNETVSDAKTRLSGGFCC